MKSYLFAVIGAAGLLATSFAVSAADGAALLQSDCATCHALTKPEGNALDHIWERQGPDLYYAGDKFNKDWLVKWLQDPVTIRPSGVFYVKHIKASDKVDVVDESTLMTHPKLPADGAEAAADALMALHAPEGVIEKGAFKNQKVSKSMGAMFFGKLRGCSACHSTAPGKGGLSGPELATAGERLQPDFIYSYIKDPQKIDKSVWMPRLRLSEADLQKLSSYIVSLSAKEDKK